MTLRTIFFLLLFILVGNTSYAQLEIVHIPKAKKEQLTKVTNQRRGVSDPIQLPFWDDFSTAHLFPSDSFWVGGQNVSISRGAAIHALSNNVLVFDGADAFGKNYANSSSQVALADTLLSRKIDLSNIPIPLGNTVYLSFFWQIEGLGELPDEKDSIRLQFLDNAGTWETVWSKKGGDPTSNEDFILENIKVETKYFHQDFQFKFQSFNSLQGAFDTWLIDYVYLNKYRSSNETTFNDLTLTSYPTSLFGQYTAIPSNQFFSDDFIPENFLVPTNIDFLNMYAIFNLVAYSAVVRDTLTNTVLDILADEEIPNKTFLSYEEATFEAPSIGYSKIPKSDSLLLELKCFLNTADTLLIQDITGVDTTFLDWQRRNDTVRSYFSINDYYAYDDGSAEFGAGINVNGGQLLYRYILTEPDTLTHIDINFPDIGKNLSGTPIDLIVRNKLDNSDNSILYLGKNFSVKNPTSINELVAYPLSVGVVVQDTIYIGFAQGTEERLPVGLDKNTNSANNIFINVNGTWQQNTELKGSLLMRPRFENGAMITGIHDIPNKENHIIIYPNPSNGVFNISGEYTEASAYDIQGKLLQATSKKQSITQSSINLTGYPKGFYYLRFQTLNGVITKKVITR